MELRSSAGADFGVFSCSTVLTDSGFLAANCRIAVSACMTKLACGMLPHVTFINFKIISNIFFLFLILFNESLPVFQTLLPYSHEGKY